MVHDWCAAPTLSPALAASLPLCDTSSSPVCSCRALAHRVGAQLLSVDATALYLDATKEDERGMPPGFDELADSPDMDLGSGERAGSGWRGGRQKTYMVG